ncbi:hypothetical protein QE152_g34201 [Popillia japonica]|uniref:Uncharacterized protein n=1 Tax=Popillia japonica TaxID=7064 RepID=A0AAW1IUH3_POPJA
MNINYLRSTKTEPTFDMSTSVFGYPVVTQKELEDIADNISEISDDGLEFSDTGSINDPEYIPEVDDAAEIPPIENTEDEGNLGDNIVEQDEIRKKESTKSTKLKDNVNITWKNKNLVLSALQKAFHGSESVIS